MKRNWNPHQEREIEIKKEKNKYNTIKENVKNNQPNGDQKEWEKPKKKKIHRKINETELFL